MPSLPKRVAWVLAGGVFGGAIAAGLSAVVPDLSRVANATNPMPMAVGIAFAVPVMDVGLYPQNVPEDRETAIRVGVLAVLYGGSAGVLTSLVSLAVVPSVANPLAVAVAFLATEYAGRRERSRLT